MTANLVPHAASIAPMSEADIAKVGELEKRLMELEPVEIPIEHAMHAGMYARTIRIPAGVCATGVLIKTATLLIVSGDCTLYIGSGSVDLQGYHVIPAGAGRKQACLAHEDTFVTMLFASNARTIDEAEAEFTDETHLLQSRQHEHLNHVTMSGETPCLE